MPVTPNPDKRVAQLIDANLDRAREGLRVIEDWCRYVLQNQALVITIKDFRQQLGLAHKNIYKRARSTVADQGLGLTHSAQQSRTKPIQVVIANCARVQEALRVVEEFSRHTDSQLSIIASQIRYKVYDLEINILKVSAVSKLRQQLNSCKLCLITRPHSKLLETVSTALDAGVSMVQYRCKEGDDIEKLSLGKSLALICKKYESLFIVNDRIDIALALNADGIHLGQRDLPVIEARRILGSEKLIGLSTSTFEEAKQAELSGCDYIGIGPVYETNSKQGAKAIGLNYLSEIKDTISLPFFAIGGINQSNVSEVFSKGVSRIAVINAIMNAKDPYAASCDLLKSLI
ncbi:MULTISPECIES: thiamine phosphate synthase [Prochlorococcus]|uniref:thiamine phosphate synthase n=1 Tax=Prochlorococcus TaxID=1218 RepID=UPI000533A27F|nr:MULTISPECIES: thiamine phosphate synthase [Prochlorococcus]KGG12016.1 Thiamin-phosphate pyrophosphorylase [Prochlorococcus sp. MIT 0601]